MRAEYTAGEIQTQEEKGLCISLEIHVHSLSSLPVRRCASSGSAVAPSSDFPEKHSANSGERSETSGSAAVNLSRPLL